MPTSILVVDSNIEFGTLIRETLEASGHYRVYLAANAEDALDTMDLADFGLAFIDFKLPNISGRELIKEMRSRKPDLSIIAIPLDEKEILDDLDVAAILSKPFYIPDLPRIVANALGEAELVAGSEAQIDSPQMTEDIPDFPPDVDQVEHFDPRIVKETFNHNFAQTNAHAALLLMNQKPLASAGALSKKQTLQVIHLLDDYDRGRQTGGAVVRYAQLIDTQNKSLFYITRVGKGLFLAILFPKSTPFSIARRQGQRFSHALLNPSEASVEIDPPTKISDQEMAQPTKDLLQEELGDLEFLSEIDLPPPDPDLMGIVTQAEKLDQQIEMPPVPKDWLPQKPLSSAYLPFFEKSEISKQSAESKEDDVDSYQEPRYSLPFSTVLLPRFPEHRLEGELADRLHDWVTRICLAWDWRAEEIDINPDYIRLIVSLSPNVAPAGAVSQLALDLSTRILEHFPALEQNLPSKRFWARKYMLSTGKIPDREQISAFVANTRSEQGLNS
jgi:CheY-like chemotaxis protein